ncbi:MAG: efflux RND transporter periplasmic adaptor subunit [Burkholderiaceae bacterium]
MNVPQVPPDVGSRRRSTPGPAPKPVQASAPRPANNEQIAAALSAVRQQGEVWRHYAYLLERVRQVRSAKELSFSLANEVWQLLPYHQGFVWRLRANGPRLTTVSGLAKLGEDSPLTTWLHRLGQWLNTRFAESGELEPLFVQIGDLPEKLRDGWREWLPEFLYVLPVTPPARSDNADKPALLAFVAYAIDVAPSDRTQELVVRALGAYGDAWAGFMPGRQAARPWRRWAGWVIALLAVALMFLPVRLSVLAPAEIVGLDAMAVNAPMEGVIQSFAVAPNQVVEKDQLLYTLDDTTLRNRREVASRQLEVARADALAAAQKSFANEASRAELASINGVVAEKEAELALVEEMLARIEVRSPGAGVAVFTDVNDWQGKPVNTGQRVMLLANPEQAGLLVWLPVPDAINLEAGAEVKTYLQVAPLDPLPATLFETSYQAVPSPLGVQSYRLRARFSDLDEGQRQHARIGLKGTAKIYGEQAALGYYLFRRPLAALRRMSGL